MNIIVISIVILLNYKAQLAAAETSNQEIDPNGYLMFCPCMGRFGNQLDQFLGVLSFTKELGRTLILPNWIEYPQGRPGSKQIPFEEYFQVEPLREYTKVILMEQFMKEIAPKIWPKGKRAVFCYGPRGDGGTTCSAKDGNPFGPYWTKFDIDFDTDVFYGPLGHDLGFKQHKDDWMLKYGADKYPVLAFTGAPGAFPVAEKDLPLQKYIKWSNKIDKHAQDFIDQIHLGEGDKLIGLHLRNGVDFKRACDHITSTYKQNFFASAQCLGYHLEKGDMSYELCYPSHKSILKQLKKLIKDTKATHVFVATDSDDMIGTFSKKFPKIRFIKSTSIDSKVDLAILGKCDHVVVNCVSSFSAFAKRQRDVEGKPTDFWVFKPKTIKSEL